MKRLSSVTYEVTKINSDREKENAKGVHLCLIESPLVDWRQPQY